jgi:hypothetical protein
VVTTKFINKHFGLNCCAGNDEISSYKMLKSVRSSAASLAHQV